MTARHRAAHSDPAGLIDRAGTGTASSVGSSAGSDAVARRGPTARMTDTVSAPAPRSVADRPSRPATQTAPRPPSMVLPPPGDRGRSAFRVLLVCTGNVCRSPVAERLLRARLDEELGAAAATFAVASAVVGILGTRWLVRRRDQRERSDAQQREQLTRVERLRQQLDYSLSFAPHQLQLGVAARF